MIFIISKKSQYPQTYCTKFHKTVSLDVDLTSEILNEIISEKSKANEKISNLKV